MPLSADKSTIFDLATECSLLFEEYVVSLAYTQRRLVEELQSQFSLWTAYTGALAPHGSSLDDRLIFHAEVRHILANLLLMVSRNLRVAIKLEEDQASSGLEPGFSIPLSLRHEQASFEGLQAISAALERLHRLASAIRKSSAENRKDKLQSRAWVSKEDVYFEKCLKSFIEARFLYARTSLIEQITKAICFHRQRLSYQSVHNKRLANKRSRNSLQTFKPQVLVEGLPSSPIIYRLAQRGQLPFSPSPKADVPVARSQTDASIPNSQIRLKLGAQCKPAASTISVESSIIKNEMINYPPPPRFLKRQRFQPCPYCAEPLPTIKLDMDRTANNKFWRQHVALDLEPYFCLSEECGEPLKLFTRFSEWLEHMNTAHTTDWYRSIHMMTWHCDHCLGDQPLRDRQEFETHIRDVHSNFTPSQIIARTKRSKRLALREPLTCPLCGCVPKEFDSITAENKQPAVINSVLGRHVGFHIKALSFLSLRLLRSDDEDDDATAVGISYDSRDSSLQMHGTTSVSTRRESQGKISWSESSETPGFSDDSPTGMYNDQGGVSGELASLTSGQSSSSKQWSHLPDIDHYLSQVQISQQPADSLAAKKTVDGREFPDLKPDDTIIAVMGITGSGKSTFISHFSDAPLVIGHGIEACTQTVDIWPCTLPDGRKLYLVDTPGFDDTRKSDTDILRELANWLNMAYSNKIKLTGIIYLHPITNIRIGNAIMRNFRLFKKLCGERGLASVVLATTMWFMVEATSSIGQQREAELRERPEFWRLMIEQGSRVIRHDRNKDSALEIINYLIYQERRITLDIQLEMGDKGVSLDKTGAGQEVITEAELLIQKYQREIQDLRQQLAEAISKSDDKAKREIHMLQEESVVKIRGVEGSMKKIRADKDQSRAQMEEEHTKIIY